MYESASKVCTPESVGKYRASAKADSSSGNNQRVSHQDVRLAVALERAVLIVRVVIVAEYTRK
jgi:hypothetical protein